MRVRIPKSELETMRTLTDRVQELEATVKQLTDTLEKTDPPTPPWSWLYRHF